MQIFYVNVGGGEPTSAARLLRLAFVRRRADGVGVKFSTNGTRPGGRRGRAGSPRWTTSTRRSASMAQTPRPTTRSAVPAPYEAASAAMGNLAGRGSAGSSSRRRDPPEHRRRSTPSRPSPTLGAQLRLTRLATVRPGCDSWDTAAPDRGSATRALPLAGASARAFCRRLLPSLRPRGVPRGVEPVRGWPGGLPDRPRRRRLCLPVRDRRRVLGRQRP